MPTKNNTGTSTSLVKRKIANLDEKLTSYCLDFTIGEIVKKRETANTVQNFFIAQLVFNAVFEKDVGAINEIVKRIDGAVPDSENRDEYANLLGDALEDIMDYSSPQELMIYPDDPAIIAIAKVLLWISMESAGKSVSKRKDREKALQMVLSRVGGNKSKPVKETEVLEYTEPDWLKTLPGATDEQ